MPFFDLSLEQLQAYLPARSEPADFDAFWAETLAAARAQAAPASFALVDAGLALVEVYDVTFSGYGGQPIRGWYLRPARVTEPLPCIVEFIGYGGGRGFPHSWLDWSNAGFAHFIMDTRGQGSAWRRGDTPDLPDGANPFTPGFMTQGILDPRTYYYRRVFTDAVRAIETARERADVDAARIAVTGGSQGGGIAIAAAGLAGAQVALCMPDVPFLCHFRQSVGKTDAHPYEEIVRYLSIHRDKVETVFSTLDYFDGLNFAPRVQAACLFSVGLMDTICPPSSVFAAYNYIAARKAIKTYAYNNHEGGAEAHWLEKRRFAREAWGR